MAPRPRRNDRRPERNRAARAAILPCELGDGQEYLSERSVRREAWAVSGQRSYRGFLGALWFTALVVGLRLAMQGAHSRRRHRRFFLRTQSPRWKGSVLRNGLALMAERHLAQEAKRRSSRNLIGVFFVSQTVRKAALTLR